MMERECVLEVPKGYMTAENAEFLHRESIFRKQHRGDTDQQLLRYIQNRASELGHAPVKDEVEGYTYLKSRLGPWPRILEKAGLKEPRKERGY